MEKYEQVTFPVTLVCAGNRRKEQNQVRKSKGFSWGAAGVSTALFTGALMADVLRTAKPRRGARFVCMEGADQLVGAYVCTTTSHKSLLTFLLAKWLLRHIYKAELGNGP